MKNYTCPECNGRREVVCDWCGSVMDCGECRGTGFDPEKVDVSAFEKADHDLCEAAGATCDLVENGVIVGRKSLTTPHIEIRVEDFTKT